MIFIPQRISTDKANIEFFFKECERQYFFENAIERNMALKENFNNKNNNSSKRKAGSIAKEIRHIKEKFNWVSQCPEYTCWKIQEKYSICNNSELNEIVKNISFVFDKIQDALIVKQRNLNNSEGFVGTVFTHVNLEWNI